MGCHQAHLIPVDLYGLYHQCLQHGSVEVPNAAEGTPWSTPETARKSKMCSAEYKGQDMYDSSPTEDQVILPQTSTSDFFCSLLLGFQSQTRAYL